MKAYRMWSLVCLIFLRIYDGLVFAGLYVKWWKPNESYDIIVMQFKNIAIISELVKILMTVKLSVI